MTAYEYLVGAIVEPVETCMEWPFQKDRDGYGRVSVPVSIGGKKQKVAAHRLAFKLKYGHWPEPLGLHSCDNPSCFNPLHVASGDHARNQGDKVIRGRSLRGIRQHDAKLTEDSVKQARMEYIPGIMGFHRLAKKYGVSKHAMVLAIRGASWRHVL